MAHPSLTSCMYMCSRGWQQHGRSYSHAVAPREMETPFKRGRSLISTICLSLQCTCRAFGNDIKVACVNERKLRLVHGPLCSVLCHSLAKKSWTTSSFFLVLSILFAELRIANDWEYSYPIRSNCIQFGNLTDVTNQIL